MIQRIQTVFLLLAIVCLGLFLWCPLVSLELPKSTSLVRGAILYHTLMFMEQYYRYYFNAIFTGTAIGFSLLAIFLFKKRSLQMLFCWFSILFIASAQGFVYYEYQTVVFEGDVVLLPWNLLSIAAIVFQILAIVYIRKDEALLASTERLRD